MTETESIYSAVAVALNKVTQARPCELMITAAGIRDGTPGAARRQVPPPAALRHLHNFPESVRVIMTLTAALSERGPCFPEPRSGQ